MTVGAVEWVTVIRGGSGGGGAIGAIDSPKTYESNFFHNDFARLQHSRYEAILTFIVLSQQ